MSNLRAMLAAGTALLVSIPALASADPERLSLSAGSSWESKPSDYGPMQTEQTGLFVRLEAAVPLSTGISVVPFGSWSSFDANEDSFCIDCPVISGVDVFTAGLVLRRDGRWGNALTSIQGGPAYAVRSVDVEGGGFILEEPHTERSGAPGLHGSVGISAPLGDSVSIGLRAHTHVERDRLTLGLGLSIAYR